MRLKLLEHFTSEELVDALLLEIDGLDEITGHFLTCDLCKRRKDILRQHFHESLMKARINSASLNLVRLEIFGRLSKAFVSRKN